jgi:hypothetical protein
MHESGWKVTSHVLMLVAVKAQESKMILSQSMCLLLLVIPRRICMYQSIHPYLSRSCMGGDLPQIATFHPWRQLLRVLMDCLLMCGLMETPHWCVVCLPDQVFFQVLCQLDLLLLRPLRCPLCLGTIVNDSSMVYTRQRFTRMLRCDMSCIDHLGNL